MFIRKTVRRHHGRSYVTYLLVESVRTPQGPRQKAICFLGDLSPGPRAKWLGLVGRVEAALQGQMPLDGPDPLVDGIVSKILSTQRDSLRRDSDIVAVHTDQVSLEKAREAGPVHVGHQIWQRLGLGEILKQIGLSARARLLSEVMVINRLVAPCSEHAMPEWVGHTALSDILPPGDGVPAGVTPGESAAGLSSATEGMVPANNRKLRAMANRRMEPFSYR